MAEQRRFVCDTCDHEIFVWSDGNPYYFDENGQKQHAHHPDGMFDHCVENDLEHICLNCAKEFRVDSAKPIDCCPSCNSKDFVPCFDLDGKPCPWCKKGVVHTDPEMWTIS